MPNRTDRYAAIEGASSPAFTRDGGTLLHLRGAGLTQIWALDLATGETRQLTSHDERVALFRRSPVDDRVIYGIDAGGDERQQLWLLDTAEPAGARALTADPDVSHEWGGWSPDGACIALAANSRDPAHFDVFVQDVATGERRCLHQGTGILTVSGFRSDGARLTVVPDRAQGDQQVLLVDPETGVATPFPQSRPTAWQRVRWSSDGRTLLALTDHGSDFLRLCRLDPDSGQVSVLYEAPGRDVEDYAMSSDRQLLATVENDRGYGVLRVGPFEGERPIVAGLPPGVVSDPSFSPDGTKLAFAAASPTQPAGLWLWEDGVARRLWQPDLGLDTAALAEWELVQWQGEDGTPVPGWLALPPGPVPIDGHRAVIWVHGGPASQARPTFRPDIQMMIGEGYAVLLPNVRGSTGYGRRSTESDDGAKRVAAVADLAAGRHWLAAHPAINADRIALMGQSYGGYMVNAALTAFPDLWKAAINYYGIIDFVTMLEQTGPWRRDHRAAEYADPAVPDLFDALSPIHRIDDVRAPVLVLHGSRDPRVPKNESDQLVAALQDRQRPVTYLTFDYAGHGFIRPDDKRRVYAAVADFLAARV